MKRSLPNILTISRIALIPCLVLAFYIPGNWGFWLSAGIFSVAGITDYLDGVLARAWDAQSKLGRVFDPIADKLLVAAAIMMLVHQERAHILPALLILSREILVSGLREYLAELNISVPVSQLAKVKTAAQMIALFVLLLGTGGPEWLNATILGNGLLWIAAVLTLATGYAYLKTGLKHVQ